MSMLHGVWLNGTGERLRHREPDLGIGIGDGLGADQLTEVHTRAGCVRV